jgi:ABC-type sugar transport system substrate-binding protein
MAHDVFISYSSKDKLVADAVCATLEAAKIRCWITPRDILPGQDWAESIEGAITKSKLLILIFSSYSNNSKQVAREISLAFNSEVTVIPFRIEDIEPKGAMKYYLSNTHWQDALTPPIENHIKKLVEIASTFIGRKIDDTKEVDKISSDQSKKLTEQQLYEYEKPEHVPGKVLIGQEKKPQDLEIKKGFIKKQNKKKLSIIFGVIGGVIIIAAVIIVFIKFPINKTGKLVETATAEITTSAESTTSAEITTAAETTQESSEEKSLEEYSFYNNLREYAKKGEKYPGSPAKGCTLAYSGCLVGNPLIEKVFESIKTNWSNAGGESQKLYYFDNKESAATALDNADKILALNPDVFISWPVDPEYSNIIASKFIEKNIPIINIDYAAPGAISLCQNHSQLGYLMGKKAVELIEGSNGISNIDKIIFLGISSIYGEYVQELFFNLRKSGFSQVLNETYGYDIIDSKFISIDCSFDSEETKKNVKEMLIANPQMRNVVLASSAEGFLIYSIDAIKEAKKWDSEKWIALTIDVVQKVVKQYINDGTIDAGIGTFPERYGEYLIPAALSLMNNEPIPQIIYIENEIISKDNINEFYDLNYEEAS